MDPTKVTVPLVREWMFRCAIAEEVSEALMNDPNWQVGYLQAAMVSVLNHEWSANSIRAEILAGNPVTEHLPRHMR